MSKIHADGWRTTYANAVPADYLASVITDDHWVSHFEDDRRTNRCNGLLLYNDETPVACTTFGPARTDNAWFGSDVCKFNSAGYEGWGEIISFYTAPAEKGKGYGGILIREVLRRLTLAGYPSCFLFVLWENQDARSFYERFGFTWDGTQDEIFFPPDTVCVDLRYVRRLDYHD